MNKKMFYLLLVSCLVFAGWQVRPSFNRPKSIVVSASSTNIPTAFSDASGSLVGQGLSGGTFQHIMVINYTNAPISFLTLPEVSSAPAASVTGQRLHVVSSGGATFDDVSIFDNLYIQSEESVISSGKVRINLW